MRNRVRSLDALAEALPGLRGRELLEPVLARYPMAITPYYLSLIRRSDPSDPIFRQCVPQPEELSYSRCGRQDPLQEKRRSPVPSLIHRYEDRALSLTTSICPVYCRHCTRKRLSGVKERQLARSSLSRQVEYLRRHPEIKEVILSGGDPLTMSTRRLELMLAAFRGVGSVEIIRLGTRAPVTLPMRVTDELCAALEKHHPIWLCAHFNHPGEITEESAAACEKLLRSGIPVLNQAVLLKGVNDSAEVMLELCRALLSIRVQPYRLYQCDLTLGAEHFRTPLRVGLEISSYLKSRIGGIGVPQFMLDIAESAAKIPLEPCRVARLGRTKTLLKNEEGELIVYPEPEETGLSKKTPAARISV